jgi:AmmeMemoRadiSam system protein B
LLYICIPLVAVKVYQGPTFSGKGIYRSHMFLLGPSHHHYTHKYALSTAFIYKTPIGDIPIDLEGRPTIHTHPLDATVS